MTTPVLESLFPVFALILAGYFLRRWQLTTTFLNVSDRLIYFIFFPAMLFWKIGSAPADLFDARGLYPAVILAVFTVYGLCTACIVFTRVPAFQAGSFSQSCYRFNTYIGVAVMMSALGEEGVRRFGILIPIVSLLAVSTLIWFSGSRSSGRERIVQALRSLVTNPLILACVSGIVYSRLISRFPGFLDNTLRLASYFRLSLAASILKLLLLPTLGFLFLKAFGVEGPAFLVGMVFLALSTVLSFFSLFVVLLLDAAWPPSP